MVAPATESPDDVSKADPSDPAAARGQRSGPRTTRSWRAPAPAARSANIAAPLGMLGLLAMQFLLGMELNLYVTIPPFGAGMAAMMRTGPLVMMHMMLGMILAGGALLALAMALPWGRRAVGCAAAGLAGILVAGLGGLLFLMDGQGNGASYLMAVGFLVAVAGYVAEIITVR